VEADNMQPATDPQETAQREGQRWIEESVRGAMGMEDAFWIWNENATWSWWW